MSDLRTVIKTLETLIDRVNLLSNMSNAFRMRSVSMWIDSNIKKINWCG